MAQTAPVITNNAHYEIGTDCPAAQALSPDGAVLWAVIFGYAQQIGTRLLDKYTDEVLDQARPLPDADGQRVAPR